MSLRVCALACAMVSAALLASCEMTGSFLREDGTVDYALLYSRRCSQCHALYAPTDYSDEEWGRNVRRYGPRAGIAPHLRPPLIEWLRSANGGAGGQPEEPGPGAARKKPELTETTPASGL